MKYLYYSRLAEAVGGHALFRVEDGRIVKATAGVDDPDYLAHAYRWPDARFVGRGVHVEGHFRLLSVADMERILDVSRN